jgi:predicted transposase YbfD/YdcC
MWIFELKRRFEKRDYFFGAIFVIENDKKIVDETFALSVKNNWVEMVKMIETNIEINDETNGETTE